MSPDEVGVAISTTGDRHRLPYLREAVVRWSRIWGDAKRIQPVLVTVDGPAESVVRVADTLRGTDSLVFRVGRPQSSGATALLRRQRGRLGVAANKNTGLELLMDRGAEHLFLADDDIWPISRAALELHTDPGAPAHSMVCWGGHRLITSGDHFASWDWPRGSALYVRRAVVEEVGGMVEEFGVGGHEHVEWSRRIHDHGVTPVLYPSPPEHAEHFGLGAKNFWHAEDMPQDGESVVNLIHRRRRVTSMKRPPDATQKAGALMARLEGSTEFVPYRAEQNGRSSATLYHDT